MTVNYFDKNKIILYVLIPDEGMCLFNEKENIYSESVYTSRENDIWAWEEIELSEIVENSEGDGENG